MGARGPKPRVLTEDEKEQRRQQRNAKRRAAYAADNGIKDYNQSWKNANRELIRVRERQYAQVKAGTCNGYRALWLANIKQRAKVKGLAFDLTLADLPIPEVCPVLGIPLQMRAGSFSDNSPSIDRIVPHLGYVRGNVQIISYRANRLKCHASLEDLKAVVAFMERQHGIT